MMAKKTDHRQQYTKQRNLLKKSKGKGHNNKKIFETKMTKSGLDNLKLDEFTFMENEFMTKYGNVWVQKKSVLELNKLEKTYVAKLVHKREKSSNSNTDLSAPEMKIFEDKMSAAKAKHFKMLVSKLQRKVKRNIQKSQCSGNNEVVMSDGIDAEIKAVGRLEDLKEKLKVKRVPGGEIQTIIKTKRRSKEKMAKKQNKIVSGGCNEVDHVQVDHPNQFGLNTGDKVKKKVMAKLTNHQTELEDLRSARVGISYVQSLHPHADLESLPLPTVKALHSKLKSDLLIVEKMMAKKTDHRQQYTKQRNLLEKSKGNGHSNNIISEPKMAKSGLDNLKIDEFTFMENDFMTKYGNVWVQKKSVLELNKLEKFHMAKLIHKRQKSSDSNRDLSARETKIIENEMSAPKAKHFKLLICKLQRKVKRNIQKSQRSGNNEVVMSDGINAEIKGVERLEELKETLQAACLPMKLDSKSLEGKESSKTQNEHIADSTPQKAMKSSDSITDNCFKCRQAGHMAHECPGTTGNHSKSIGEQVTCTNCNKDGHLNFECPNNIKDDNSCYICGELGHYSQSCPSKSSSMWNNTSQGSSCFKCGEVGHFSKNCRSPSSGNLKNSSGANSCFKCGEPGHFSRGCHSKLLTIANGYKRKSNDFLQNKKPFSSAGRHIAEAKKSTHITFDD